MTDEAKIPSLSMFVDMLADAKYHHDDLDKRAYFILNKAGIADEVSEKDLEKMSSAIQKFYDADKKYRSNMDSFLSHSPRGLAALFGFTSFEDKAAKGYEPVKNSRNAAYDALCELVNKYKGRKVSESLLEENVVANSMLDAIQIALEWRKKGEEVNDTSMADSVGFWAIVGALDDAGNAWAKKLNNDIINSTKAERKKIMKDAADSDNYHMILDEISKISKQRDVLQEILDASLKPGVASSDQKLSYSDQKRFDSALSKLEKMEQDFITKCKNIK